MLVRRANSSVMLVGIFHNVGGLVSCSYNLSYVNYITLLQFVLNYFDFAILAEAHGTRPDLTDQPLPDADHTWYTDGSSLLQEGQRKAGAAVTTETEVIWAKALPAGTSAQRAELMV